MAHERTWRRCLILAGGLGAAAVAWAGSLIGRPIDPVREDPRLQEFGAQVYLFRNAEKAVNLTRVAPDTLPAPPPVANPVPAALAPAVAFLVDTREDGTYRVGDTFRIRVRTSSDAYLQLINIGTSGDLAELFPRSDKPLLVKRGETQELAGTDDEKWEIQPPLGKEWVLAFATSAPVRVPSALMAPCRPDDVSRLDRLQKLKAAIQELCRSEKIDVGFQERSFEVRGTDGAPQPAAPAPRSTTFPPAATYALCIGISTYRHGGIPGFAQLDCAAKDARAFREKLVDVQGVPADQVKLLTDKEATRDGIMRELSWLRKKAGSGKYAYFFFSGHGTQAEAPESGDGTTHSGLVPHDFNMKDYENGKPTPLVFDRELGAWIESLSCSGLVGVVDACFCGAITKGMPAKLRPRGFFLRPRRGSKSVEWNRGKPVPHNTRRANCLVFEAAQWDQLAYENPEYGHGLLSGRLLELFDQGLAAPVVFQDVQGWVMSRTAAEGKAQTPALVNTMPGAEMVPFGKN